MLWASPHSRSELQSLRGRTGCLQLLVAAGFSVTLQPLFDLRREELLANSCLHLPGLSGTLPAFVTCCSLGASLLLPSPLLQALLFPTCSGNCWAGTAIQLLLHKGTGLGTQVQAFPRAKSMCLGRSGRMIAEEDLPNPSLYVISSLL